MTSRQYDFIKSLRSERQLPDSRKATFVNELTEADISRVSNAAASRIIEWLLAQPRNQAAVTARSDGAPAAGRYALVRDGAVKFYVVDRPTEGRWSGYVFLNAQASDERHPIRDRQTRQAIFNEINRDPEGAMQLYARELGRCGFCGRTLTDEVSRAAGIGPECAAAHGIDRSVWAARQQRDAVRLVTGDKDDLQAESYDEMQAEADMEFGPYTVYRQGRDRGVEFTDRAVAIDYARNQFNNDPRRAVLVTDNQGDTVAAYDL